MSLTAAEWDRARLDAGLPIRCPSCAGEGVIGGLVVGNNPSIDERCARCAGRGFITATTTPGGTP